VTGFQYKNSVLHADGVDLSALGRDFGTPAYVYSSSTMERAYRGFADAFAGTGALICYAVKANGNLSVIRTFANLGAGADVVSGGELARALAAGVPASRIVFAGVGKTEAEMAAALDAGILQFNVESEPELIALNKIAIGLGKRAEIAVRVNPDVDAKTHAKISTGRKENKFGIDIDRAPAIYALARDLPGIDAAAVAVHIGSQLTDLEPLKSAFGRVRELVIELKAAGHPIRRVDLGGGIGIAYRGENVIDPVAYAEAAKAATDGLGCRLVLEPGRCLVGDAGLLLARVVYVKQGADRRFVILDAGMNDLIRPALYDAYHEIVPVLEPAADARLEPVDVVGPVCESADLFASQRALPHLEPGDLVALKSAGAYSAVMASTYNARPTPPEIMARDGLYAVIKPRRSVEDLLADEAPTPWHARGDAAHG
jgi:diaminopimelate decarboxylase